MLHPFRISAFLFYSWFYNFVYQHFPISTFISLRFWASSTQQQSSHSSYRSTTSFPVRLLITRRTCQFTSNTKHQRYNKWSRQWPEKRQETSISRNQWELDVVHSVPNYFNSSYYHTHTDHFKLHIFYLIYILNVHVCYIYFSTPAVNFMFTFFF